MAIIQSIRGTKDILPEEIKYWQYIEKKCRDISHKYAYTEIRTPIFEKTEVFSRGVGSDTDIVNKEMYTFSDRSGESITLRPEQTAALVRAVVQNNLLTNTNVLRLFYIGSYFRYERPQKGRLRQFHQYGAECISSQFAESDAEIIMLANSFIKSLGIEDYKLRLNTLGNSTSRKQYLEVLTNYLNISKLSPESKNRTETNPLRVLDSKHPDDSEIILKAPSILDFLDIESLAHFETVKKYLNAANIKYMLDSTLVRGLDYYCDTVFEFQSSHLGSQDAFGGGGRYNRLFTELGGKDTPAVGFAMGIERLLLILIALDKKFHKDFNTSAVVIPMEEKYYEYAISIASKLRDKINISTQLDVSRRSLKAQLRDADRINSKYALIIGEEEFNTNSVTLKFLEEKKQIRLNLY